MAKKMPQPFEYRGGWRATVTLANGKRPVCDFAAGEYNLALRWIADQLANADSALAPELGGPTRATLADALELYANLYTRKKGGAVAELSRISHYLEGAGKQPIKLAVSADGKREIVSFTRKQGPSAWQQHTDSRREARSETYAYIAVLAQKKCSAISTADIRRMMAAMEGEGLSPSTIQKEVALLKHMFNMAAAEWNWLGFKNPCLGIKLGKSERRFVFLTTEQRDALWKALEECDSPYYWPMVQLAFETTLRIGSLLQMTWDKVDLEGRIAVVPSKTGTQQVAFSRRAVEILKGLPRDESGRVFPMTYNAADCAWDGVRKKAGLPTLQFKDLRHVAATDYVRRGMGAHQLKSILGHTTLATSEYYVNLVHGDLLEAMDRTEALAPQMPLPPAQSGTAAQTMNERRARRLQKSVDAPPQDATGANVISLSNRRRLA
ncbi:MAG: site-specific integrase [Oxalobacter sp.]|nr:MAG: site-specific integrase [Oxalobacter sp.]